MSYPADHTIAFLPDNIILYIDRENILHIINKDKLIRPNYLYQIDDIGQLNGLPECLSVCTLIKPYSKYSILILRIDGSISICCFGGAFVDTLEYILPTLPTLPILKIEVSVTDFYLLDATNTLQTLKISYVGSNDRYRPHEYSYLSISNVGQYTCNTDTKIIILKKDNSYEIYGYGYPIYINFGEDNLEYNDRLLTGQKIVGDENTIYILNLSFITFGNVKKINVYKHNFTYECNLSIITYENIFYEISFNYSNFEETLMYPKGLSIKNTPVTPISFNNSEVHAPEEIYRSNYMLSVECEKLRYPIPLGASIFEKSDKIKNYILVYIVDNIINTYIYEYRSYQNDGFEGWKSKKYTLLPGENIIDIMFVEYTGIDIYDLIFVDSEYRMHYYNFQRNEIIRGHPIENVQFNYRPAEAY